MTGTSFHVGSGCSESEAYDRAIKKAKNLFDFGALLGCNMKFLDIGGGFPGSDDVQFEKVLIGIQRIYCIYYIIYILFPQTAGIVNKAVQKHFADESIEIIAEPGRYFVAAAYTLICKIHAKREVRSESGKLDTVMYFLNDGVYGSFNCILYDHQVVTAEHYLVCIRIRLLSILYNN